MSEIREFLHRRQNAGEWVIGQVRVLPNLVLRHVDDGAEVTVEIFTRAEDAREIAKYDDAGTYRPLKSAPNLRHGWELQLIDLGALHLALDLLYPAALGTWLAFGRRDLVPVSLRDTLGRQTGMYRVTQLIRDDQAGALIEGICVKGCLRQRRWQIAEVETGDVNFAGSVPVLCAEACNLFVAACRPPAKENLPKPA